MLRKSMVMFILLTVLMAVGVYANAEEFTVGWTVAYFDHPVYQDMMRGMKEVAEQEGIELIITDGQNDPAKQTQQIDNFIAQGVDGIMVTAAVADPMLPAVRRINQAGIPLIVVDRRIYSRGQNVSWDATVSWDMPLSGAMGGAQVVSALKGLGNVVVIEGTPGAGSTIDRGEAFDKVIEQFPGINVIYRTPADFNRAKGLRVTEDLLQRFKADEIDAIYYMNDEMALGGLEAVKAANLLDEFKIISVDGDADAIQAVRNGEIDHETIFFPADHAVAMNVMARILRGGGLSEDFLSNLTYDGRKMDLVEEENGTPWVKPTVYWITEENADTVEGF